MTEKEIFENVIEWAFYFKYELWTNYYFQEDIDKRRHVARLILIEKLKWQPNWESLLPESLKQKIKQNENFDAVKNAIEYDLEQLGLIGKAELETGEKR